MTVVLPTPTSYTVATLPCESRSLVA